MTTAYEAWQNHEPHPDDDFYEAIWRGELKGWSQEDIEGRIAKQQAVIDSLEAGTDPPAGLVRGQQAYADADPAFQLVNARRALAEMEEALRCHGRNLTMNQNRVARARIDQGGGAGCDDGGGLTGRGLNQFR